MGSSPCVGSRDEHCVYDALGSFIAIPLGQMTVGLAALRFGTDVTLFVAGGLLIAASAAALSVPGVRSLTTGGGAGSSRSDGPADE